MFADVRRGIAVGPVGAQGSDSDGRVAALTITGFNKRSKRRLQNHRQPRTSSYTTRKWSGECVVYSVWNNPMLGDKPNFLALKDPGWHKIITAVSVLARGFLSVLTHIYICVLPRLDNN